MLFPSIPMLCISLLLVAATLLFYTKIRKSGVEKPDWVDAVSLVAAVSTCMCANHYICLERGCLSTVMPLFFVTLPVTLVALAFPPGMKGRASFTHRLACVGVCLVTGLLAAFLPVP